MINFTVGPVTSGEEVLKIGGEQVPYFRTQEFSSVMKENERLYLKFLNAPGNAKAIFITGSGTASMEASVINTLTKQDKALIINGGSFGFRFKEICETHDIPFDTVELQAGNALRKEDLLPYENGGYTAFIVNIHETSTGVRYSPEIISDFCKRNGLFLIVDAISSFLADEVDMKGWGADIVITGSQKALACAPGISLIALSDRALSRTEKIKCPSYYLDFKSHLVNMERGQTPFTPAVGILRQINARLKEIEINGGVNTEIKRTAELAKYFREKIKNLPFSTFSKSPSNAVTSLKTETISARELFLTLKDEYGIWICPNGGELKDKVFRVGHIGDLKKQDYDVLINAFYDLIKKGKM